MRRVARVPPHGGPSRRWYGSALTVGEDKVTTRARRKAFEKDNPGLFEDLDRTVRLSASLSNPDTTQEQLGGFFR